MLIPSPRRPAVELRRCVAVGSTSFYSAKADTPVYERNKIRRPGRNKTVITKMNLQTSITPISELSPGKLHYTICVRVSRLWEFRGNNEQNDIKHLDLVLIDQKGDSIYAEVPANAIPYIRSHLQEKKIVYMSKITVEHAKSEYRTVDNPYIIKLNRTEITEAANQGTDFPKYTFSLVPFDELHCYVKKKERFLDIIGKIIGVSDATIVHTGSGDSMMRRVIHLQDHKGNTIELSLSGKRATEFDGDKVLQVGQNHHVIAIFVGTLMKLYKDTYTFLSGTSACRWYINENDIPEIKAFQKSLPAQAVPIQRLHLQTSDDAQQNIEKRTLLQLKNMDPFIEKGKYFECTATIVGITENQTWCYRACKVCNSKMKQNGTKYECTKKNCPCTQFDWKYKIPFVASDTTSSLEFMFFEKKATELIGKSAETLHKQYDANEIPPEISEFIGHKFTFIVKVQANKSIHEPIPSFDVIRIKERFGKQSMIPGLKPKSFGSVPLSVAPEENLPPLIPIASSNTDQNSPSQRQLSEDNEDMEIEQSGIWDQSDSSNKRRYKQANEDNLESNDEDDDEQQRKKAKK
ncbi:unnamed protein product [Urochloa humidicola]